MIDKDILDHIIKSKGLTTDYIIMSEDDYVIYINYKFDNGEFIGHSIPILISEYKELLRDINLGKLGI
jgi:hypothetical protein